MLLGIDTGGTFTDFILFDGADIRTHKTLSTPGAPERAILQGIRELGITLEDLRIIHGSTIATNAVLEGKGARTAYITNYGLKDVLTIGRQARRELYNLQPQPVPPPVPDELLLETGGRLSAQGEVIEPLTDEEIDKLIKQLAGLQPESLAINLLFSFLDNRFERQIKDNLPRDLFVTCSHEILPEQREYERGITTWLNAYVGPLVRGYLAKLAVKLNPAKLAVMRSSGDTCAGDQAGREAVHLMLSGPAGGLAGAKFIAATAGRKQLLTFDMGGTSTDVALIDESIGFTSEGKIAGYPVAIPMVNMHTIGAGGGSIAFVDQGGGLQVGPESAGAEPGPVCYGKGGNQPTVTDANLVLGRLPETARLAGSLTLDYQAAVKALDALAKSLHLGSVEIAAEGVIRIANEHMVQALKVISVQQGIDPRDFVLVAFGGAGGLHVCDLANALDINQAMVPVHAGVLSAMGMLVAPAGRQLSRTLAVLLEDCDEITITSALKELAKQGRKALKAEGIKDGKLAETPSLDLCYRGQAYTLNIPWQSRTQAMQDFHTLHQQRFGHRLDAPVELVNVRLGIRAKTTDLKLPAIGIETCNESHHYSKVYGCSDAVAVYQRNELAVNKVLHGPIIICDTVATTFVAPQWHCQRDPIGNLLLHRPAS